MVIKVFLGGGGHHLECFGFACWVFFGSIFGRFVVPSDGVTCFSLVFCIVPVPIPKCGSRWQKVKWL